MSDDRFDKLRVFCSPKLGEMFDYGQSVGIELQIVMLTIAFVLIDEGLKITEETGFGTPGTLEFLKESVKRIESWGKFEEVKFH